MKTLKHYLIGAFFVMSFISFAQQKMAKLIMSSKDNGITFKTQEIFPESQSEKEDVLKEGIFKSLKNVSLLNYKITPKELEGKKHISTQIPINGNIETLDLIEVDDKFYSYEVVTSDKEHYTPNKNSSKHYRGIIRGAEKQSLVAISLFDNDVSGFISYKDKTYTIAKLKESNDIIIYDVVDLIKKNEFECGLIEKNKNVYDPRVLDGSYAYTASYETNCVRFYFETEFDMFQSLGSVANVENYVTALYNQVATLYYNEGIDTRISEINVWTSTDPYTSGSTSGTLSQFQTNTSSINGDLGHLLTFRNIGGGMAAGFNGLCNSNVDQSLAVSGNLNSTIDNVPTYSWNVYVTTHEFGHLFGSRHTHACVWNGNNTAIDGCSGFTEGSCPTPGTPSTGGTIMSYCHTNVGINFSNGFGSQPGNVLRHNVANASCLTDCENCIATGSNFDLYMKDQPSDSGVEPNPNGIIWMSQDIWIRQNLDGGTTHQNAEYKTLSPNGVYVKVRNRGSETSDCATLKVYWTKASAGLLWPTNFMNFFQNVSGSPVLHGDIVGTVQIPAIAPGGEAIVELPWYPPNPNNFNSDTHHFCLTARIISADDPMTNEVNGRIEPNAQNNNNIVQKNISVYNNNTSDSPVGLLMRGVSEKSQFIDILFTDKGFKDDEIKVPFFERGGTVEVTIEKEYFDRMLKYGSLEGEGIKVLEQNKVLIYSNEAAFIKVPLEYREDFLMQFKFNLNDIDDREEVIFDVLQQSSEEKIIQGGERFVIIKSKKDDGYTYKKEPIQDNEELRVTPNPNKGSFTIELSKSKNGTYYIYDIHGNLIQKGNVESKETKLNLPKLRKGTYFINVHLDNKILKQSFIKK